MRANELMIGDWVYSTFSDKPCKVIGIEQYESEYVNVKVTNVTGAKDINSIYFIPLTAEILEKNGFVSKKGFMQKGNFGDGPLIIWHTEDNKILSHFTHELEISDLSSDKGYRIRFICNYVHVLQHALRLSGIDKTIEL